jgi:cysteinyl-tRNA synthetase
MNDDFNTPVLIANLFEGAKSINLIKDGKETISVDDLKDFTDTINAFVFEVLGLKNNVDTANGEDKLSSVVDMLIQMRKDARDNKDWALSDKIRDELLVMGIQLKDGKDGTTFSVN